MEEAGGIWRTVRVAEHGRVEALARFLEASGCEVRPAEGSQLEVRLETVAPWSDAAELELDLYLRLWEATTGGYADRAS
jgi:hypothetical protein